MKRKKNKSVRVQGYVPEHIRNEFRRLADKFGRSESDLARVIIENFVKQQQTKERVALNGQ